MRQYLILPIALVAMVAACGGKSYRADGVKHSVHKDKVLETSYGNKKLAKFFFKKPHVNKSKQIRVIGSVDVPGDSSPQRCAMAADLQARVEIAGFMQTTLENQLQFAAEGFSIQDATLKQIATQSTKIENLRGLQIDNRFWEKKLVRNGPDTYVKYTCYSRAAVNRKSFEEQVNTLLENQRTKETFSEDFVKKMNESWDAFFKPVDVEDDKEYSIQQLESIQ